MSKRSNAHFKKRSISAKKAKRFEQRDFGRFEDKMELLENAEKERLKEKKKKKTEQDVQEFGEFFPIEKKNILKLYDYENTTENLLPVFNLSNRQQDERTRGITMNLSDLVSHFFDDFILDAMIEYNISRSDCLPTLLYKANQGIFYNFLIFFFRYVNIN